jgi:hypothetical protein
VAASKLSIYNGALMACEERKLASLTENREPRRLLDDVWSRDGVKTCLQVGLWNFAMRTMQYDYSPSVTPSFGYRRAFDKPSDWVRTAAVCEDEYFNVPLLHYQDDAAFWWSDLDTIYVRYVSSDTDYGFDYAKWPQNFQRYVEHYFASQIVGRLTGSASLKDRIDEDLKMWLAKAKGTDAMDEATVFLPPGSWSSARHSYRTRRDRGSRGRLIG